MQKVKDFLSKKDIKISAKRYFVDAMSGMALGLFASLLIGTIFSTVANLTGIALFATVAGYLGAKSFVVGAAIAAGTARPLGASPLVTYSALVVGAIGNDLGGPACAFLAALVAIEIGKIVAGETKVDIIITPTVTILIGSLIAILLGPAIAWLMATLGNFIMWATECQPVIMGILVAVVVGIVLTLPISSAALCAMIGLGGIAAGAAVVGCCAQMIGFAVMSYRENRFGGLIAQGLGTSMLQMGNIVKNPLIWIPPTFAAAVVGPLSTTIFKLEIDSAQAVNAGMGTCGLVGPIGVISSMEATPLMWTGVALLCFVLPAVISLVVCEIMRKMNFIRENDLKLDL